MSEDIEVVLREIKPAKLNQLVIAESKRIVHYYMLDPGVQLEDALIPDFWSNAASKLHRRDLIELEPIDSSWWAQLLVTEVGPEFAKTVLLHKIDLPVHELTTDDLPLGTSVFFLGNKRLWAAMRGPQILRHSFTSKGAAVGWLIETMRSA